LTLPSPATTPDLSAPAQTLAGAARRRLLGGVLGLGGVALLGGCGFQLRRSPPMPFARVALSGFAPRSRLERELRDALRRQVEIVATPSQADVHLRALEDVAERVVVASTAASQVRELQLRLRLRFRIDRGSGRNLSPEAELFIARDLSYNETQALAKEHEEEEILRDMHADIVQQVLRRLAAVRL
jgi:LPS-assembly lipoprotein